jgi:transcription initiation factor TFIIIB Brf1 subunit/transcription initiation factor TFIIB
MTDIQNLNLKCPDCGSTDIFKNLDYNNFICGYCDFTWRITFLPSKMNFNQNDNNENNKKT